MKQSWLTPIKPYSNLLIRLRAIHRFKKTFQKVLTSKTEPDSIYKVANATEIISKK
jgi:hypothetical protein